MKDIENGLKPFLLKNVAITGDFWSGEIRNIYEIMLPYQWQVLNDQAADAAPSGCMRNFRIAAGMEDGSFYGMVFQDSDLAKWIEAVAYALTAAPNDELEKKADEAISIIARAQQEDGYLDTYFIINGLDKRWTDLRDCHELYCAGHMMEAAVAYYEATGKRDLLDVMYRTAQHLISVFGPEKGKIHGYPGHPEVELALMRMYHVIKDKDLLKLAKYFIDERGKQPFFFEEEALKRKEKPHFPANTRLGMKYFQSHLPLREQKTMEGHSFRALYLLSGMIDVAKETQDQELMEACWTLYRNVTEKRMYVTGGVGSTHVGEAFTCDYDLPNNTVYAETCASIALIFAAYRLLNIQPSGKITDVIERALYNTCLAGKASDDKHFFYVNPLEVIPELSSGNPDCEHVLPERSAWFGCACCPPNLARLICSIGSYAYGYHERDIYVHLYISSKATYMVNDEEFAFEVITEYPKDGKVLIRTGKGKRTFHLHMPSWCKNYSIKVNGKSCECDIEDGYAEIDGEWERGDTIELKMEMEPRKVYANPAVRADIHCVSLARGPLVYCAEEADNGPGLFRIRVPENARVLQCPVEDPQIGRFIQLTMDAVTISALGVDASLYTEEKPKEDVPIQLKLVPYYLWANRGRGEMRVWIAEQ